MFQLIIIIFSIVLVSALAIATIYYGVGALETYSLKAQVTTLVNAGEQILGAQSLYFAKSGSPTSGPLSASGLVPTYFSGVPGNPPIAGSNTWSIIAVSGTNGVAVIPLASGVNLSHVCAEASALAEEQVNPMPQFYCSDDMGHPAPVSSATSFAFRL